jgi:predicted HD phosphohydrolase
MADLRYRPPPRRAHNGAVPGPQTVDELFACLAVGDRDFDDETVDLLAHGLQCAALLADTEPADLELQVAGLVHDLGTIVAPGQPSRHARIGADAVRHLLGERVATLVGGHDQAKRYLVTTDASYRDCLSSRSIATLRGQGGLLDPTERVAFEAQPEFHSLLALRRADDAAKDRGRVVPALEHWRRAVDDLASAHTG